MIPLVVMLGLLAAQAAAPPPATPSAPAPSPVPADSFPRGEVVERVACATDPTQTYALYLPSAYTPGRRWPVAILMDPRGRALAPMQLFRAAAEKRGWILMSSYDTASDGPWEPNAKAVGAMVPEAFHRHAGDPRRIYLAGFSGTARAAWDFALRLRQNVAGVIGFGAGLPFELSKLKSAPFPFFGGAGRLDFNFEEMRALDEKLESMKTPHRFEPYDGPHSWGPQPLCAEAIDWMELEAMKSGLREKDDGLAASLLTARLEAARATEASGDLYAAWLANLALQRDATGLHEPTAAAAGAKAAELERTREVRRVNDQKRVLRQRQAAYEGRLNTFLQNFRTGTPPAPGRALIDLEIASLKKRAGAAGDPLDSEAARRLLAMVFANVAFYEPNQYRAEGDPARAAAMLEVAAAIKPDNAGVLYNLACAWAVSGHKDKALDALGRSVEAGFDAREALETDKDLESLRGEPAWRGILGRLRPKAP